MTRNSFTSNSPGPKSDAYREPGGGISRYAAQAATRDEGRCFKRLLDVTADVRRRSEITAVGLIPKKEGGALR